jgi:hypothetical protein
MCTNRSKDRSCLFTFAFADGRRRRTINEDSAADGTRCMLHRLFTPVSEPCLH